MKLLLLLIPIALITVQVSSISDNPICDSGTDFQANTYHSDVQERPDIAIDKDGNFVIVWQSNFKDRSGYGIFGKRFDSKGNTEVEEFMVNTGTLDSQRDPSIAMNRSGDFVVAWSNPSNEQVDVLFQMFDSNGTRKGGEAMANTYTTNWQYDSDIAARHDGGFIAVWTSMDQDGSEGGVFGQRFSNRGFRTGSEFAVNFYSKGWQYEPSVAMNGKGDFAVVWTSEGQDRSKKGVFAQLFAPDGRKIGSEFQVNSFAISDQYMPDIAMDREGNFVVVWNSLWQDEQRRGVYFQRFDNTGKKLGEETRINRFTSSDDYPPSVSMDSMGNFIIVWVRNSMAFGRIFDKEGKPMGNEFVINNLGGAYYPKVALNDNGRFAVAWVNDTLGSSGHEILARWLAFKCVSCSNGELDGAETDVDCGGVNCTKCGNSLKCARNEDCMSGFCSQDKICMDRCRNGLKDGDEIDIDCGSTCGPCGDWMQCRTAADCLSSYCSPFWVCLAPSCGDGLQNGNESDIDCGGSCMVCLDGKKCNNRFDCFSRYCSPDNICSTPTCSDGWKNGEEEGIDCGGSCPENCQGLFIRGAVRGTYPLDIGDAVFILNYMFAEGSRPECLDAADVNDDGQLDIGDPISLLNYMFSSGPEPRPPFPEPGIDPTEDIFQC